MENGQIMSIVGRFCVLSSKDFGFMITARETSGFNRCHPQVILQSGGDVDNNASRLSTILLPAT